LRDDGDGYGAYALDDEHDGGVSDGVHVYALRDAYVLLLPSSIILHSEPTINIFIIKQANLLATNRRSYILTYQL